MGFLDGLFGGNNGFDASKSNQTTNNTTNNYADNRQVNDAGGGVIGTGNVQTVDSSTRTRQTWTDNSDRSQTWADNSDRSTFIQNSTVDGGAFSALTDVSKAQTEAAAQIAKRGLDTVDLLGVKAFNFGQYAQDRAMDTVDSSTAAALRLAETSATKAYENSSKALGFQIEGFGQLAQLAGDVVRSANQQSSQANAQARDAYDGAVSQTNGNKTLLLAACAVVAVVAFASFGKH